MPIDERKENDYVRPLSVVGLTTQLREPRLGIHENGQEEFKPIARLHDERIQAADALADLVAENNVLRAERDALKLDAERYRRLRNPTDDAVLVVHEITPNRMYLCRNEALDAAIDAAIASKP